MGLEISRRLIGGKWRTASGDDGGGNGNGGSSSVRKVVLDFDPSTPDIVAGIPFLTLADGEMFVLVSVNNNSPDWDGNSPSATAYAVGAKPLTDDLFIADLTAPDTEIESTNSYLSMNASNAAVYASGSTVDYVLRLVNGSQQDAITDVDQGTKTFTVAGDQTAVYPASGSLAVGGSTGNDGAYSIVSSTHNIGPDTTDVVVAEAIPDNTVDGNLVYGDPQASTGQAQAVALIAAF